MVSFFLKWIFKREKFAGKFGGNLHLRKTNQTFFTWKKTGNFPKVLASLYLGHTYHLPSSPLMNSTSTNIWMRLIGLNGDKPADFFSGNSSGVWTLCNERNHFQWNQWNHHVVQSFSTTCGKWPCQFSSIKEWWSSLTVKNKPLHSRKTERQENPLRWWFLSSRYLFFQVPC